MSNSERSYDEVWDSMWENEASDDETGKTLSDNGSPGDEPLSKKPKLAVIFFYLLILQLFSVFVVMITYFWLVR